MTRTPQLGFAPWSDEEIEHLHARQADIWLHPYTCEWGHTMYPTRDGWRCRPRFCWGNWVPWLRQRWAHRIDLGYPQSYTQARIVYAKVRDLEGVPPEQIAREAEFFWGHLQSQQADDAADVAEAAAERVIEPDPTEEP